MNTMANSLPAVARYVRWLVLSLLILFSGCFLEKNQTPDHLNPLNASAWTHYGGSWQIKDHEVSNESSVRGDKLIDSNVELRDFSLDVDVATRGPFAEAGVIFRSSGEQVGVDSYHGYFAGIRAVDGAVELLRSDYGSLILAQAPLRPSQELQMPIHLHVAASGCSFLVVATTKSGESTSVSATQPKCIANGHIGLRSSAGATVWSEIRVSQSAVGIDAHSVPTPESQNVTAMLPDAPLLRNTDEYTELIRREVIKHSLPDEVQQVSSFVLKRGKYKNVTLFGTVISGPPFIVINDGTGSVMLPNANLDPKLEPGNVVEVTGTLVSESFAVSMIDTTVKVLWSDLPAPPLAVSAMQLTNGLYRARSIAIQGTLISKSESSATCILVLRDQSQLYRAVIPIPSLQHVCKSEVGSLLRLRGVGTTMSAYTQNIYPFAVIVSGADVLAPPLWWSGKHVAMLLASLLIFGLFLQWGIYKFQQWHLQNILAEREQIAFDMHDTLAQSFTGIAYQLEAANMDPSGLEVVREHIRDTLQTVKRSHREASNAIAALRPQNRDANSILGTLRDAAERMSPGGRVRIITELTGASVSLPVQITDAIFRIGQEAIANSLRHSFCHTLKISIYFTRRDISFSVVDDGQGFDVKRTPQRLGLAGIRARAKSLGAILEIASDLSSGTRVQVVCPLPVAGGFFVNLRRALRITRSFRRSR